MKKSKALLEGYHVLDLCNDSGFLCGKVLADLGADVIKVEKPDGDDGRKRGPFYKDIPHPEKSLCWLYTNLGKRGVTLDIESERGSELLLRMVVNTDILIESFYPGYMAGLGLSYQALREINPRLIFTSITPFGQEGPYSHFICSDIVGMSMGGMTRLHGEVQKEPVRISIPLFDLFSGIHGAVGTMVALYHRELTGVGQSVDVSGQEAISLSLMNAAEFWDIININQKGTGHTVVTKRKPALGDLVVPRVLQCKDGYIAFILGGGAHAGMVKSTTALRDYANECGMALEIKDYNFSQWDAYNITLEEANKVFGALADFVKSRTKAELLEAAVNRSILLMPILTARDMVESPQLKARNFWINIEHPELGDVLPYPSFPVKMSGFDYHTRRAPRIGEHNEDVYLKELGLSREEFVLLKTQGII